MYADSTAVLGPLSRTSEPHSYDLCAEHAASFTVPRGWRAIRVPGDPSAVDDLVAIAHALSPAPAREASAPAALAGPSEPAPRSASSAGDAARVPAHRLTATGRHLSAVRSTTAEENSDDRR